MQDSNSSVRLEAVAAAGEIGEPALPLLRKFLEEEENSEIESWIERTIRQINEGVQNQ